MMCELRELDVASRGVNDLVEKWKRDHRQVRAVWSVEDLVAEVCDTCSLALRSAKQCRDNPALLPPGIRIGYLIEIVRQVSHVARETEALGAAAAAKFGNVDRLEELRHHCRCLAEFDGPSLIAPHDLELVATDPPAAWLQDRTWTEYEDR